MRIQANFSDEEFKRMDLDQFSFREIENFLITAITKGPWRRTAKGFSHYREIIGQNVFVGCNCKTHLCNNSTSKYEFAKLRGKVQHSPLTLYDLKIGRAFVKPVSDQEQQQQLALDLGIQNQSNFPYYDIEKQESLEQKKCQYIICNFWVWSDCTNLFWCLHIL